MCDDMKNLLARNKILIRCGKYSIKRLIWENQHLSWIMKTRDALRDNVKMSKNTVDNNNAFVHAAVIPPAIPQPRHTTSSFLGECGMQGRRRQ